MSRRAKIVGTIGPACCGPEQIAELVAAGRSVGVLVDLQGPKIRLGIFSSGPVRLVAGREFTITGEDIPGDAAQASTTYPGLCADVRAGEVILVDDGRVVLEVLAVRGERVRTRVLVGGPVSDHKGLNVPGARLNVAALSAKDEQDLRWALDLRADMVALSFVQGPDDAAPVRAIMDEMGARLPLIAKIEKPQAVAALPEVLEAFDGLMVARGDLGVELPLEQVPMVQKRAVTLAQDKAKPVIVATQMLESMISAPRPTRAEVSDVANAVLDGADAVMLSAETGVGQYPVEAVATMDRIIVAAERECLHAVSSLTRVPTTTGGAIARAAAEVGAIVGATALVAFTMSGETARRLARYRSPIPLLAFTPERTTRSQLSLSWGVETFIAPPARHTDEMVRQVETALLDIGRCQKGDKVVIVAGNLPGTPGKTNALRVHCIGDAIASGYS